MHQFPLVNVHQDHDMFFQVKATGPGLEPGCKAGRRLPITVDSRKAGKAPLNVVVEDEVGNPVDVDIDELEPGLHEVAYKPKTPGI